MPRPGGSVLTIAAGSCVSSDRLQIPAQEASSLGDLVLLNVAHCFMFPDLGVL